MSEEADKPIDAGKAPPPDVAEEHPLSLVLFAPLRTSGGQAMILWGLVAACIALGIAGFFVQAGHHFEIESVPLFFGVFGFMAFSGAVLSGWPLGKWLRRPEDFYDRKADDNVKAETPDA